MSSINEDGKRNSKEVFPGIFFQEGKAAGQLYPQQIRSTPKIPINQAGLKTRTYEAHPAVNFFVLHKKLDFKNPGR